MKKLEIITTKYLILTVFLIVVITIFVYIFVTVRGYISLDILSKYVDIVFKTLAVIIGAIWGLNRYFAARTDALQIRVDPDVKIVRDKSYGRKALLIYRLDIVNTGRTLIPQFAYFITIEKVSPSKEIEPSYELLYRLPQTGLQGSGEIEPNSWSAINDSISISSNIKAIRIYIEIHITSGNVWTWHKTFKLTE